MMLICRYGEIFLKGSNRSLFERALIKSIIQRCEAKVTAVRNRMVVQTDNPNKLRTIFGLTSFSHAVKLPADIQQISATALSLLAGRKFSTFCIRTQTLTKTGPRSIDVNIAVGDAVRTSTGARVDLNNADITVGIEIIDDSAYVFIDKIKCPGGLPYGVSGAVTVWMDDRYAELAALLMMKRGCTVGGAGTKLKHMPTLQQYNSKFTYSIYSNTQFDKTDCPVVRSLLSEDFNNINHSSLYPLIGMTVQDVQQSLEEYARVY